MMWFEGYYTEENEPAAIDFGKMAGHLTKLLIAWPGRPQQERSSIWPTRRWVTRADSEGFRAFRAPRAGDKSMIPKSCSFWDKIMRQRRSSAAWHFAVTS